MLMLMALTSPSELIDTFSWPGVTRLLFFVYENN